MTQRYKITTQITPTLNGGYDVVAIAVPDEQGDFVRYDAVSRLTEEKTIEEHRVDFEEWANEYFTVCGDYELNWENDLVSMAYIAWKAAKGAKE